MSVRAASTFSKATRPQISTTVLQFCTGAKSVARCPLIKKMSSRSPNNISPIGRRVYFALMSLFQGLRRATSREFMQNAIIREPLLLVLPAINKLDL